MIVFVTGATAGFGAAVARCFVSDGHRVVAAGRRRERLDALRGELGEALLPLELDVRDREAVARAFAELPGAFAGIRRPGEQRGPRPRARLRAGRRPR